MESILLVEGDVELRSLLSSVLEEEGYSVRTTESGLEAVVLAGRERFDAILLDIDLEELSGRAVARVVRDLGGMPVIALSGRLGRWEEEMLGAGAAACMRKPYSLERLLSMIRGFLRARTKAREAGWPTDVRRLSTEDLERVTELSDEARDRLPFGAIAIDADRRIVAYNAYEQEAASYWKPTVIGKRFEEVAPCFEVREFARLIGRGLAGESLDEVLRFVFPHHGGQCLVSVRLYRDEIYGQVWVFVSKRA